MTYTLVLLRHGESEWNAKNLFTGWVDVDLTEKGRAEARARRRAAQGRRPPARRRAHLAAAPRDHHRQPRARRGRPPLDPGQARLAAQRAPLRRAAGQGQEADPRAVRRGAVHALAPLLRRARRRRIDDDDEFSQAGDPRYAGLGDDMPAHGVPQGRRSRGCCPTGRPRSMPDLADGQTVLVAAHGNSLRALVKHLDGISDEDIAGLNIPTGMPLRLRARRDVPPTVAGRRVPRPRGRGAPPPRPSPTRAADRPRNVEGPRTGTRFVALRRLERQAGVVPRSISAITSASSSSSWSKLTSESYSPVTR